MIVQSLDGHLWVIRQTDHAALAAVFAEHWGNATFATPSPRDPLITAAAHHDDGWLVWEAAPRVDPATSRPYQFTDLPVSEHAGFYRSGIERVLALDPYAGLLTVLHLAGLYQRRFGTDPQIPIRQLPAEEESVKARLIDDLRRQMDSLRADLPNRGVPAAWLEDRVLWCNYKFLQVYDRLSLYFCMAPPREAPLEPVPVDYDGRETRLELRPAGERAVSVAPYPFDCDPLTVSVRACALMDREYDSDDDLRGALAAAPEADLHFELRAG